MTTQTKPHEQLIAIYNEIDAFMRREYGGSGYVEHLVLIQELAGRNRIVNRYQQELRMIAQLRNSLVHNPFSAIAQPIAEPHPLIIKRYSEIKDALLHPYSGLSIAIKASQIYTATPSSKLNKVLKVMDENIYTHVPVIKDEKMIGVFSENTLLSYLADAGEAIITKDMTMADFSDYLPLESHHGEVFRFLPRTCTLTDVYDVFNQAILKHERIGMVFITNQGKVHEKPVGIVTAWDLASPDMDLR